MKHNPEQLNTAASEWSSLQNDAEAGSSSKEKTKSKKDTKRRPAHEPSEAKRWSQRIERSEFGHEPIVSEGLIWLRAASERTKSRSEKGPATPEKPAEEAEGQEPQPAEPVQHDQARADNPAQVAREEAEPDEKTAEAVYHQAEPKPEIEPEAEADEPSTAETQQPRWQPQPEQQAMARDEGLEHPRPMPSSEEAAQNTTQDDAEYAQLGTYNQDPGAFQDTQTNLFEAPPYSPPPLPPEPSMYRRSFWNEAPAVEAEPARDMLPPVYQYDQQMYAQQPRQEAVDTTRPEGQFASDMPPGLQRTPADVTRAAWGGFFVGRFLRRRTKRRIASKAHQAGYQEGLQSAAVPANPYEQPVIHSENTYVPYRPLEAQPLHSYPQVETNRVHVQPVTAESVPKVAVRNEAAPVNATTVPEAAPPTPGAHAEAAMGRKELMNLAKTITVDGIRLKDVFNAKRIDEAGLRAVVETYLRGGDVKQQLTQEVINKEKSFERDPVMRRNRSNGQVSSAIAKAGGAVKDGGAKLAQATQKGTRKAGKALASGAKHAQFQAIEQADSTTWIAITAIVVIYSLIALLVFG